MSRRKPDERPVPGQIRVPLAAGAVLLLVALLCGCAGTSRPTSTATRPFSFQQDRFAYSNELVSRYQYDVSTGQLSRQHRESPPSYAQHCFVMARSARQFFQHARFDPGQPVADEAAYRRLIRRVTAISPQRELDETEKIVIPGYTNLFTFSQARESLLKEECGGAWRSYCQRGNWRMVFPFSRSHQQKMAEQVAASLRRNRPPVVHLVRFPKLSINHAILLIDAMRTEKGIEFTAYDPNAPARPVRLTYDSNGRTFHLPMNHYFEGGRVDVYQIYHQPNY